MAELFINCTSTAHMEELLVSLDNLTGSEHDWRNACRQHLSNVHVRPQASVRKGERKGEQQKGNLCENPEERGGRKEKKKKAGERNDRRVVSIVISYSYT